MPIISIQNISKNFNIGFRQHQSVLAHLKSIFSGREPKKKIQVLDEMSLDIHGGEIIGITGDNGSGKSTLLRIIAGIYEPDGGIIKTDGKVVSIINLGVGLMERLPMRDNIYLVGSLFGMRYKEIKDNFDAIVDFSELGEFVDTKIYQFSAGMIQRLAFSIAIYANPAILLLDEVFEVGDESFKKKSSARIKQLAAAGGAVILVSHDQDLIKRNCTSVVRFEHGKIIERYETNA